MTYLGKFNEKQLLSGEDKKAIEEGINRTGLKYIKNKIVKEKGETYMKVWLVSSYEQTY